MNPQERERAIEQFEQACRRGGLALTMQRRLIYETLLDRQDHPTAEAVRERVRRRIPNVSLTTVYRVLEALEKAGAVVRLGHPGAPVRFEARVARHHHLVCQECGILIDITDRALDDLRPPDVGSLGFEVRECCVHFRGLCRRCRQRLRSPEPPADRPGGARRAGRACAAGAKTRASGRA